MSTDSLPNADTVEFLSATDPFTLFETWYADASEREPVDPNAMALATVGPDGLPNVRIVLLKGYDRLGFVFYTNFQSQKGVELLASGKAAVNFHWKSLGRQVRARGTVEQVSDADADAYYSSRPLVSRIGAWASRQSQNLPSRDQLLAAVSTFSDKYGENPPRPPHWSGFRIRPLSIEFWQNGEHRLHDRLRFDRQSVGDEWTICRLYP